MKLAKSLIKTFFTLGLILILTGLIIMRQDDIVTIFNKYVLQKNEVTLGEKNEYYRDYDFNLVQNTNNFSPRSYQDILNIYYTIINAGKDEFTFYCNKDYTDCLNDIQTIANNQALLSDINNYVHPFNSFSHIETEYDTMGKITIRINKVYSDTDIKMINDEVDTLYTVLTNNLTDTKTIIKKIHDYIINNTKYDSNRSDYGDETYRSDTAYGPLFEKYAVCGGYSDLMELFLERLKIKSFKVSSNTHVWNAVYLDGVWYNLDLTWDDPVADNGRDYLEENFFLISTNELLELEETQHNFDEKIYSELKRN